MTTITNISPSDSNQLIYDLIGGPAPRALHPSLYELLGGAESCALDLPLTISFFRSTTDTNPKLETMSLRCFADRMAKTSAKIKEELPLMKLGTFEGGRKTEHLRSRHGVEIDYDAGNVAVAEAVARLRAADLAAVLFTSSRHTPEAPRWRVLVPTSRPVAPGEAAELVARVNGAIGGIAGPESFDAGRCYFFGGLEGRDAPEVHVIDGRAIDLATEIQGIEKPGGSTAPFVEDDEGNYLEAELAKVPLSDISDGDVDDILAALPSNWVEEQETWLTVGRALSHQYEHQQRGFDRWCDWSKQSTKFQMQTQRSQWKSFKGRTPKPVTFRTLIDASGWKRSEPTIDGFPATEDGIAQAFTGRHRDDLKFDHSCGSWFRWTGTHWQREQTRLAFEFARRIAREFGQGASPALVRTLGRASTPSGVETMARADRAHAVTSDEWDRDPWLLGTPDGVVELTTGRLRPARPGDKITKVTAAAPVPLETFDPARDCPRWLGFLRQATRGDAGLTRFLQQWAGYGLAGDTSEEALLFIHGPGGSGKSTFINTVAALAGDYAVNVPTATLTAQKWAAHPTEIARLHGHRLAYASETEQGRAWNENRIKELTGGDTVSARFMGKDFFEFRPQFKLTIVGNNRPAFENVDGAMRRRFNVVPFDAKPDAPDHGLKAALEAEFPGILAWAIGGCLDWQRNGLVRPEIVTRTTSEYLDEQDDFGRWIDDACDVGPGMADTTDSLFTSWNLFAMQGGGMAGDRRRGFPERMKQRGFQSIKDTAGIRGRGYAGIKVRPFDDFEDVS